MRAANRTTGARLRLVLEPEVAIGPGKADLLEAIGRTGSIAAAGRDLGMSYKRAWSLIEALNRDFGAPLVATSKGGQTRGGAELTALGRDVLDLYRRMEANAGAAIESDLDALRELVRHRAGA